jgi:hypothetical protein
MSFPGSLDSFTTNTDFVDDVFASDVNAIQDAIVAIETELGTDPAGSATDLKTRLAVSLSGAGLLNFAASSGLTISSGSITASKNWHTVDTEGAASTDDLDTITAGTTGQVLVLQSTADARNVIIRHGVGNILCGGAANITLDLTSDLVILMYDGNQSKWIAVATGSAILGMANIWTGVQSFGAAVKEKYSAVNANATLDLTHRNIWVDASGGAITIALPPASSSAGLVYDILKADGSANAVTIDGNASETINGATTKVLSNQYSSVTIICNGSGWYIK